MNIWEISNIDMTKIMNFEVQPLSAMLALADSDWAWLRALVTASKVPRSCCM